MKCPDLTISGTAFLLLETQDLGGEENRGTGI